ncbi:hypothetical protein B0H19DRAFT_570870 [Mycena capillaripes]|nr:hypothetical protein B0H19DRAFT_570870 [Mycena capillaripes]
MRLLRPTRSMSWILLQVECPRLAALALALDAHEALSTLICDIDPAKVKPFLDRIPILRVRVHISTGHLASPRLQSRSETAHPTVLRRPSHDPAHSSHRLRRRAPSKFSESFDPLTRFEAWTSSPSPSAERSNGLAGDAQYSAYLESPDAHGDGRFDASEEISVVTLKPSLQSQTKSTLTSMLSRVFAKEMVRSERGDEIARVSYQMRGNECTRR